MSALINLYGESRFLGNDADEESNFISIIHELTLYWPKLLTTQVNDTSRPCVTVRLSKGWRNSGSGSVSCPRPEHIKHFTWHAFHIISHGNSPLTNVITMRMLKRVLMMAFWMNRTISIFYTHGHKFSRSAFNIWQRDSAEHNFRDFMSQQIFLQL